ncbi:glycosyltransferase family 2 protein [Periconia macrospinosa]|uniref:chitin synthase n=1 Tax=Periconia macrospinosa TaxID=97972 RepID=A0A2V1E5Q2_9PLEO|nr:glycosyltransferase family 2 protein [Periconia macrospinosa]
MQDLQAPSSPTILINSGSKSIPTLITKRKPPATPEPAEREITHRPLWNAGQLRWEKNVLITIYVAANTWLVYIAVTSTNSITDLFMLGMHLLRPTVDFIEISLIICSAIIQYFQPPPVITVPEVRENIVYLLPCYNETYEELTVSIKSLAKQSHLEAHQKALIIVADGRCRGKGMAKTAAGYIAEDIIEKPLRNHLHGGYTAWDGTQMAIEVVQGHYKGLPVLCIIKEENKGKRDGIIVVRRFLHKFNLRNSVSRPQNDETATPLTYSEEFFTLLSGFLQKASLNSVEYVVGLDADTRFDTECVFNLMQTARESPNTVGVTGLILADPRTSNPFSPMFMFQYSEYYIGQYRRRLRQHLTSSKVTCLPGCCQLFRVLESTCGDEILREFGYFPGKKDGLLRTIRSTMSEDRDHVCLVLSKYAEVRTKVNLRAKVYTSVPQNMSVYLSQRRRWTLGPFVSDLLLLRRKTTGWMERIAALSSILGVATVLPKNLQPFFRLFRSGFRGPAAYMLFSFSTFRTLWDISILLHAGQSATEIVQFIGGLILYYYCGSFVGLMIQLYTLYYIDDFRWGKTRVVVEEETPNLADHQE